MRRVVFFLMVLTAQTVWAAEYEEVSYDDLVNRLNGRKERLSSKGGHPLDDVKIRAGFGFVSASHQARVDDANSTQVINGFQIALGVDLFTPNVSAEAALRNFGSSRGRSLRETDVKVVYRDLFSRELGYHTGLGLSTRDLKITDLDRQFSLTSNTPSAIGVFGLDAYVSSHISLGFELSIRPTLIDNSPDRLSMDAGLRLDTAF